MATHVRFARRTCYSTAVSSRPQRCADGYWKFCRAGSREAMQRKCSMPIKILTTPSRAELRSTVGRRNTEAFAFEAAQPVPIMLGSKLPDWRFPERRGHYELFALCLLEWKRGASLKFPPPRLG